MLLYQPPPYLPSSQGYSNNYSAGKAETMCVSWAKEVGHDFRRMHAKLLCTTGNVLFLLTQQVDLSSRGIQYSLWGTA